MDLCSILFEALIDERSAVVVKNCTHWVHHSPHRNCSLARFVWTEWPLHHFGCLTETVRNERGNKSAGTNCCRSTRRWTITAWLKSYTTRQDRGGKRFFKILGKDWGRENMNMKMKPCLPSMLTQAVFCLWCLSVVISNPPHCGAPVWKPPTCDSLEWLRRGGGGLRMKEKEECNKGRVNEAAELWGDDYAVIFGIFHALLYLVLYALTRLQAGKDLALNRLDPQFSLLVRRCLEVPRLTGQRHNDELKGIFLFCKTQMTTKWVL